MKKIFITLLILNGAPILHGQEPQIIENQTIQASDYADKKIDHIIFKNCIFEKDFAGFTFDTITFQGCSFSSTQHSTTIDSCRFQNITVLPEDHPFLDAKGKEKVTHKPGLLFEASKNYRLILHKNNFINANFKGCVFKAIEGHIEITNCNFHNLMISAYSINLGQERFEIKAGLFFQSKKEGTINLKNSRFIDGTYQGCLFEAEESRINLIDCYFQNLVIKPYYKKIETTRKRQQSFTILTPGFLVEAKKKGIIDLRKSTIPKETRFKNSNGYILL